MSASERPQCRRVGSGADSDNGLRLAREALQLGALAYVDKPFDLAYLKRVVAMALRPDQTKTQ